MDSLRIVWLFAWLLASPALAQKTTDVRVDVGDPLGAWESLFPEIQASGSSVYVVWGDERSATTNPEHHAWFNRSHDGGATWLAEAQLLDTGGGPAGGAAIVAVGSSVYAVYGDAQNGSLEVTFRRSLDRGDTWLPPQRLSSGPPGSNAGGALGPRLAAVGERLYVVYPDDRNGAQDIYFNRSLDGGATWLANDVRLDTGAQAGASRSEYPFLAASASGVFVVWIDERNSPIHPDLYFNGSLDGGSTWLASDLRLDHRHAPGTANYAMPSIASMGSAVYVTWSTGDRAYFNRSLDGGRTWLPRDARIDRGLPGAVVSSPVLALARPALAARSVAPVPEVCVAWVDKRNNPSTLGDVYFTHSSDGGLTWPRSDQRLNLSTPPGAASTDQLLLATAGSAVYAAWALSGPWVLQFNRSLDGGATWLASDVRLDRGPGTVTFPALTTSGGSVYVAWADGRNDPFYGRRDIYFNLALGHQPYGADLAGSGGLAPQLSCASPASIGRTLALDVSQGLGGASGMLALGTNGPASIPNMGGTLLVQPPFQHLAFVLGGSSGTPGAGSGTVRVAIPNLIVLLGQRVNSQALVVDPGAPSGVSMSAGLETWIL